jgi:hypothetical protein
MANVHFAYVVATWSKPMIAHIGQWKPSIRLAQPEHGACGSAGRRVLGVGRRVLGIGVGIDHPAVRLVTSLFPWRRRSGRDT